MPDSTSDAVARCRCHESPEAWRGCPLPQHDHRKWTGHGWNCPESCLHPDALAAKYGKSRQAMLRSALVLADLMEWQEANA